ncbi:DNA primase [Streptomyces sp. V3I7]|nr:DNA primase [Streptomyces sp. V3I7]
MGDAVELEAGGRTVRLSSPDKVFFPERGFTKLDLARYYVAVGTPSPPRARGACQGRYA